MASVSQGGILYTFTPRAKSRSRARGRLGLKDWLKRLSVSVLLGVVLTSGGYLGFEYHKVLRLRQEVKALSAKHKELVATYEALTTKEVVYAKAKALGLAEPKPEQIMRLK
jgi:predicted negative regulator of RcsB-dependent stress response